MVDAPLSLITRTDLVMCFISFSAPPSLPPSLRPTLHPSAIPLILSPPSLSPSLSGACCAPSIPQRLRWRLNSRVIYCDAFAAAWFK